MNLESDHVSMSLRAASTSPASPGRSVEQATSNSHPASIRLRRTENSIPMHENHEMRSVRRGEIRA